MILQDIPNPIVFSAFKNSGRASEGEYIRNFNGFLTNYGNSFNLTSGIFTSPREGVFEFSAAIYHNTQGANDLIVEKSNINVLGFHTTNNAGTADPLNFSWIMELQQGDTVIVKVTGPGSFSAYSNQNWIFNGKFLRNI